MELDTVVCGDCLDILPTIPDQSVDAVITDPPYPHIKRDYGTWTTEEWWALIVEGVIPEVRRILKPTGSAVFILQPNSEKVGVMRGWLWEFMAWVCREWNMVQDVWWWNVATIPSGVCNPRSRGLLRASLKSCIWCGLPKCFRDQEQVLWNETEYTKAHRLSRRARITEDSPSGHRNDVATFRTAIEQRGGVTPYNVIPLVYRSRWEGAGANGHSAGTPLALMDWWQRYIVPDGGLVVDPFMGSGTTAVAAVKQRKHFFGCDTVPGYVDISNKRIEETQAEMAQMELVL